MALSLNDLRCRSTSALMMRVIFALAFFLAAGLMPAARACPRIAENSSHHHVMGDRVTTVAHHAAHGSERPQPPSCNHDCCLNGCALPGLTVQVGEEIIQASDSARPLADDLRRRGFFPPVATPPPRLT